jgi:hypothetical protein
MVTCDNQVACRLQDFERGEPRNAKTNTAAHSVTAIGNDATDTALGCEQAGADAAVWKRIVVGNYRTAIALRDALVAQRIGIGDLASEMLRLPTFTLMPTQADVDLSVMSAGQLVRRSGGATFADVHAHAIDLGLELCPPEVGPQLRLQYLDQRLGEYLLIGMAPLPAADSSEACFVVGNGGAGLIIIGRSAEADMAVSSRARFVFARGR